MSRVLAATVILPGEENGSPVVLLAGETPTDAQAALITNPKAWAVEADVDVVDDEPEADEAPEAESDEDPEADEAPEAESDDE